MARKTGSNFRLETLRAEAAVANAREATIGALGWRGHVIVAVMADGCFALTVMGECNIAVGARDNVTTGGTLDVGGKAATIQQQNDLPAVGKCLVHGPMQRTGDGAAVSTVTRFAPQVDRHHIGHGPVENTARHLDKAIDILDRAVPALERRCGRTENQRHILVRGSPLGHVASMVTRGRRLFERGLVFLVQHDQTQVRSRGKDGTSGADDHLHLAGGNPLPVPMSLGIAQMAMQHGDRVESTAKTLAGLRRQADFRHEHDRLTSKAHHLLNRLNVNFCLAATSNPVQ